MSMGDGVLDSGKASDLSVCSWPVEPIQWTPFPLLQQLASHRTPTVSVYLIECVFERGAWLFFFFFGYVIMCFSSVVQPGEGFKATVLL